MVLKVAGIVGLAAQIANVIAHGGVTTIGINGVKYTGYVLDRCRRTSRSRLHLGGLRTTGTHATPLLVPSQPIERYLCSATGQVSAERPYSSFDPILSPTGA